MSLQPCDHTGPAPHEKARLVHDPTTRIATLTVSGLHDAANGALVAFEPPRWAEAAYELRHSGPATQNGEVSASFRYQGAMVVVAFRDRAGTWRLMQRHGHPSELETLEEP